MNLIKRLSFLWKLSGMGVEPSIYGKPWLDIKLPTEIILPKNQNSRGPQKMAEIIKKKVDPIEEIING